MRPLANHQVERACDVTWTPIPGRPRVPRCDTQARRLPGSRMGREHSSNSTSSRTTPARTRLYMGRGLGDDSAEKGICVWPSRVPGGGSWSGRLPGSISFAPLRVRYDKGPTSTRRSSPWDARRFAGVAPPVVEDRLSGCPLLRPHRHVAIWNTGVRAAALEARSGMALHFGVTQDHKASGLGRVHLRKE